LGVLGTQETFYIVIAGLFERDSFDLFLPEFDKRWVIHLRETCCCSINLCTWRPNTVYKNRRVRRHHILNNPDATGRILLWGITLGPWEITYQQQSVIKSQVLPDFIVEWMEAQMPELPDLSNSWTIYVDDSKRVSGAGAGVVLVSPQGDKMRYILRMQFANPSNNEAEYEAVLHGMHMAKACGATHIKIHGDLNLIAQQVMKECDATCVNMIAYWLMYDKLEGNFEGC
jgi:hypothetical protein